MMSAIKLANCTGSTRCQLYLNRNHLAFTLRNKFPKLHALKGLFRLKYIPADLNIRQTKEFLQTTTFHIKSRVADTDSGVLVGSESCLNIKI